MRILHVTPYYEQAWAYGGIPRVVAALATGLSALGHSITVCTTDACLPDERCPRPAGSSFFTGWRDTTSSGVEVRTFANVSNRLAYHQQLFLPLGLLSYLRTHVRDFDVAHIHACRNVPGVAAARYLRRARVPYIVAPNGTAPILERRRLAKQLFDGTLGRRFLDHADQLIAVTEAERRQLEALHAPPTHIAVIPNPVDLAQFDPPLVRGTFRRDAGLGTDPVVLFLGKLTPRKRLDVVARAFADLVQPGARLVVAGNDMGYEPALSRLVHTLRLGDRYVRIGLLAGRARLEALADADVVVYPSQDEVFGLVPLEAILCGAPVVVAGDSGCGQIVRNVGGGLVVEQGSVPALTRAVTDILNSPDEWRRQVASAGQRVRDLYGSAVVCRQVEALYRSVTGSST